MKILLNVPYAEKDLAKGKGAKWNASIKKWYVDDCSKLLGVEKWINQHNIICENLYLLKKKHRCWKCGNIMEVVLLATDKSYNVEDGYKLNTNVQILTYVTSMPNELKNYVQQFGYSLSYSKTSEAEYYINHCNKCRSVTGDNYLHELPEQAFYKKLCYKNSEPISYAKINNQFCVPLQANLPYYDEICSSMDMILHHMETGVENRASLNVCQKLVNQLFDCSIEEDTIEITGV